MAQLEEDMRNLADDVVTRKDFKAAMAIVGEVLGFGSVVYIAFMALTAWIPGLGIPITAGCAAQCLRILAREYVNLPTDQRRVVAKVCKFLRGIVGSPV